MQLVHSTLSVQKWGNSLAVRIPAALAQQARFQRGQPITMRRTETGIELTAIGEPKLSLAQKLALFNPQLHGGEMLADQPIGVERFD